MMSTVELTAMGFVNLHLNAAWSAFRKSGRYEGIIVFDEGNAKLVAGGSKMRIIYNLNASSGEAIAKFDQKAQKAVASACSRLLCVGADVGVGVEVRGDVDFANVSDFVQGKGAYSVEVDLSLLNHASHAKGSYGAGTFEALQSSWYARYVEYYANGELERRREVEPKAGSTFSKRTFLESIVSLETFAFCVAALALISVFLAKWFQ